MTNVWILTTTSQITTLVDAGRRLGGTVTVVAVGEGAYPLVDAVRTVPLTAGTPAEAAAPAVAAALAAEPGDVILVPNRPAERVLAGAVAARLGAPVLTQVLDLADGTFTVSRFGGISVETLSSTAPVVLVMAGGAELEGEPVPATAVAADLLPATITAQSTAAVVSVNLGSAKRIVAAGRGFASEADLQLARDLAGALNAEVACSRPLAEGVNWMPKESYVGISGQSVKPDLYVAVGISGQLQHMAGAKESRTIIAINSDDHAPIFAQADYGIVGDLNTILPALIAALR